MFRKDDWLLIGMLMFAYSEQVLCTTFYYFSGIVEIQNSVRISGKEDRIIIDGITEGYVWIYDINGVLVKTLPATGERMEIRLQERGIYLVKYAGRTVKVKI